MRLTALIFWTVGLALFLALIVIQGVDEVGAALAASGWGFVVVTLYHLLPLGADAYGWRALVDVRRRPRLLQAIRIRWAGESVNGLLPAVQLGGELVRIRLAMVTGIPGSVAGASVTADLTVGVLTQIVFSLAGVAVLLGHLPGGDRDLVVGFLIGLSVLAVLVGIFLLVQNAGMFRFLARLLARVARGRDGLALVGGAEALDRDLSAIYRRRGLYGAIFWRSLAWVLGTGEIWFALYFLGYPVSVTEAFMLESLIQAVRSAGFFIPAGLGLQEGAFMLLGGLVGLGPETGLALSLMRRIREILLGVPGLLVWQLAEGRRLWRRKAAAESGES